MNLWRAHGRYNKSLRNSTPDILSQDLIAHKPSFAGKSMQFGLFLLSVSHVSHVTVGKPSALKTWPGRPKPMVNLMPVPILTLFQRKTWGRGWMTKASGVGERRKGRGELRRDCHHRVAALFVPTRMQQWYIDIWYITMIYIWGRGQGGGPFAGKITWCPWGAPEYVLKQEDSSELTLAFVIMTIIANNDKM